MSVTVLTALSHTWEGRMVEIVDRLPGIAVGRRCVDLADLLAAAAAGHGDVAPVSADLRGLDRDALAHPGAHGVAVVGASPDGDEEQERRLRQLGVQRHVHLATPGEDLVDSLTVPGAAGVAVASGPQQTWPGRDPPTAPVALVTDSTPPPVAPAEAVRGRVIAVWGPTGAPGRSTVAVNPASELAAAGAPTVLIDLDTYGAAVAQLLSVLDEAPGLASAARSELGTLDLMGLARLAVEVSPRFRVLTGIPTPNRWPEIRPAAVEQIIDLSRSLGAFVVLDLGFAIEDDEELSYDTAAPRRNAATLSGLAEADDLLLVGSADPVGLQRMVRAVQGVGQVASPDAATGGQPAARLVGGRRPEASRRGVAGPLRRGGGHHLPPRGPCRDRRCSAGRHDAGRVRPRQRAAPGHRAARGDLQRGRRPSPTSIGSCPAETSTVIAAPVT
uniref:Uncharacterized protein n=1 Tax=Janibacter limosus TaxID=53458 RepID=A0AC61U1T1_9MICO|nr:hypothetical protein [Janibacter limosus]